MDSYAVFAAALFFIPSLWQSHSNEEVTLIEVTL